ncbi:MAG: hypothetical protein QOH39_3034 [Verrucomicrobiota bacterium]
MHRTHHDSDGLSFENHVPIQTTGGGEEFYDDIDRRCGWSEDDRPADPAATVTPAIPPTMTAVAVVTTKAVAVVTGSTEAVAVPADDLVDGTQIAPQSERILKVFCLLLAAEDTRQELLTLCAAFGLQALIGGRSFSSMAREVGVSRQAFTKKVLTRQLEFKLPVSRGQKRVETREIYRNAQLAVWQRPERQPQQITKLARDFIDPRPFNHRSAALRRRDRHRPSRQVEAVSLSS